MMKVLKSQLTAKFNTATVKEKDGAQGGTATFLKSLATILC